MEDKSYLDKKYFIDPEVYNCPFCNRRNVQYTLTRNFTFHWRQNKPCFGYLVKCNSCDNYSMHLSFEELHYRLDYAKRLYFHDTIKDIDSKIFYSVPTSFFVMDSRIPKVIRELITEAEGCLKMNFLTGASACTRKAIYELLIIEKAEGSDYESRIKSLKAKNPDSDPTLFDILSHIQDITSDKIHEQSWDKWEPKYLKLIIETLKTILHDIYVIPSIKKERSSSIQKLLDIVNKEKKSKQKPDASGD